MNENLNLIEILKDAPKGTKLWSPICGECELVEVKYRSIDCKTTDSYHYYISFTSSGKFGGWVYNNGECVVFPSKDNRDWSTFKVPKKHKEFKPFQKVLRVGRDNDFNVIWTADFYSHYDESTKKHILTSGYMKDDITIIPYEGNEDKLGKIYENRQSRS